MLEADDVLLRTELDELSATVDALTAKIVELIKHVFGGRSERAKKGPDGEQSPKGEGGSEKSDDPAHRGARREAKEGPATLETRPWLAQVRPPAPWEQVQEPDAELLVCRCCGAPHVAF